MQLKGKKILLGITASIAAYKSISLVRLLVKSGADVKVVMTPAATEFVSPLVLSTLSKNPIIAALANDSKWTNHVMLGRWADVFVIAPLSCNSLAKMVSGICDNMLMATYLSATCPIMVAPAMDEDMWYHETTQRNLSFLAAHHKKILDVNDGELASGLFGKGRMMEPEEILQEVIKHFDIGKPLLGKNVIVTAGPTYEAIDPVRFIGNHSSGLMGVAIAEACHQFGAQVTLILGPSHIKVNPAITTVRVTSASQMFEAFKRDYSQQDIAIMTAAVADYRPEKVQDQKIKKDADEVIIKLVKNPDILAWAGQNKAGNQLVVGFALETENELPNAQAKLARKNADLIVLNSLNEKDAGFGKHTNKVTLVSKHKTEDWEADSKERIGRKLALHIATLLSSTKTLALKET